MPPYVPEEVDVFSVPHSRMKELVNNYYDMMQSTNFTDILDLQQLLEALSRTFREFKTHEQIENRFIMKRLKLKMKKLSIRNSAVCNCHKDHAVTDMMMLLQDGYQKKTDQDRLNYGLQLKQALEDFTDNFIPHMKEEEEVFQPLLLQFFTYEELCELKQKVIQQHLEQELEKFEKSGWMKQREEKEQDSTTSSSSDSDNDEVRLQELLFSCEIQSRLKKREAVKSKQRQTSIESLPPEVLLKIFQYLNPRDLCRCMQVAPQWSKLASDRTLWKSVLPPQWATGDWTFRNKTDEDDGASSYHSNDGITLDDDADIDESMDNEYSEMVQQVRNEVRILTGLTEHILPRVGAGVQVLGLANCRTLTNGMLQRILSLCPNLEHLDMSQTRITDAGLRRLGKNGCGSRLKSLNLSGCVNITDATMVRLALALSDIGSIHGNKPAVCADNVDSEDEIAQCECRCEEYYKECHRDLYEGCVTTDDQDDTTAGPCTCGETTVDRPDPTGDCRCDPDPETRCSECTKQRQGPGGGQGILGCDSCGCMDTEISEQSIREHCDCHADKGVLMTERAVEKQEIEENYDKNPKKKYHRSLEALPIDNTDFNSLADRHLGHDPATKPCSSDDEFLPSNQQQILPLPCHSSCLPRPADDVVSLEDFCMHQSVPSHPHPAEPTTHAQSNPGNRKCCKKKNIESMRKIELRILNLSGCFQVTDLGLRVLAGSGMFSNLHYLDLSGCFRLTAEGLHEIVAVSPSLRMDDLYYCDNILEGPFADMASGCRNLQCSSRVCCRGGD